MDLTDGPIPVSEKKTGSLNPKHQPVPVVTYEKTFGTAGVLPVGG